jgi:hypothetical protein
LSALALGCFLIIAPILVSPALLLLAIFGVMIDFVMVPLLSMGFKSIGDDMAIALNRSKMKELYGYDGFFTRKEHERQKKTHANVADHEPKPDYSQHTKNPSYETTPNTSKPPHEPPKADAHVYQEKCKSCIHYRPFKQRCGLFNKPISLDESNVFCCENFGRK